MTQESYRMPKVYSNERKNVHRREETQRVRQERVITGYFKYRYPKVYAEAYEFYQHLDKTYPKKKDLRRTNEYSWVCNGSETTMKKYYPRKEEKMNKMVLEIPLISVDEIPEHHTVLESSMQEETVVETIEPTVNDESSMQKEEPVLDVVETGEPSALLPVNDETLEQIIGDLREDPDIANFFDEFDFEYDDCPLW